MHTFGKNIKQPNIQLASKIMYIYIDIGHAAWHTGSQFPDKGMNLCPLQ